MAEIPRGGAGGITPAGDLNLPAPVSEGAAVARQGAENHEAKPASAKVAAAGEEAAQAKLGAGGTSAAAEDPQEHEGVARPGGSSAGKVAGGAAAVPAAGAAGQVMVLAMFINWLKGLMMNALAIASNLWNLAMGLLLAFGKAAVGAVFGVGAAVSAAVGGTVSAVAAGVASFAVGGVVVTLVAVSSVVAITSGNSLARMDSTVGCQVTAQRALAQVPGSDGTVDQQVMANAKTTYSVLSAWGMPDENVAGIIGNWDAESHIDPTSVQGYFNSPQAMSDEKKAAAANLDNGIGLGQWTFGRNQKLRDYAAARGTDWWTLESQLGYMISTDSGAEIVKGMIKTSQGTAAQAALYFHRVWEVSADSDAAAQRRADNAVKWMGLFSGWTKNQQLADSILTQAGTTVEGANTTRAATVRSDCRKVGTAQQIMKPGGLTLEEATALMEDYKVNGDTFLKNRYGAGGPGECGSANSKSDNCVGFSTYFVNKFTSFQQYAPGNGIDTAGSMAHMMGKQLTTTPTVYSVASGPGSGAEGHTFVVLGIQGDQAVIGEAACGSNHTGTRARMMSLTELTSGVWHFVDVSDLMLPKPLDA